MKNKKSKKSIYVKFLFLLLLLGTATLSNAQIKIQGQVFDTSGESIIGANVAVQGTTNGTITDFNGKFQLSNVPDKGILIFSYVGYKNQQVHVNGKSIFKIVFEEDSKTLEDVVVVGYGTPKKPDLTGSVMQVKSRDITAVTANNPIQSLQGRVTGVSVV